MKQSDQHKPNEPRELTELKAKVKEDKKMALLYLIPLAISIAAVIISLLSLR